MIQRFYITALFCIIALNINANTMNEEWKTVATNTRYEVSNYGNVRSVDSTCKVVNKLGDFTRHYKGQLLKISPNMNGYPSIRLRSKIGSTEKERTISVHVLVWDAFGSKQRSQGIDIDHVDGNKTNNMIDNLRLLTRSENMIAYHKLNDTRGNVRLTRSGSWEARCQVAHKNYQLGFYKCEHCAHVATAAFVKLFDDDNL